MDKKKNTQAEEKWDKSKTQCTYPDMETHIVTNF